MKQKPMLCERQSGVKQKRDTGERLRVRSVLGYNIWDYLFWGDKAQFQLKAKMHSSDIIPALDFEKSLPPHYLRAWNRFLQSLRQKNVSTIDRDRLVRAILPIFHHPHIKAPMRILFVRRSKN